MIELRQIRKSYVTKYETLPVLKGLDLSIENGEMVSIMGASGSGKSTLLNIMGLLDRFDEGEYLVDGQSVKGLYDDELANLRNRKFGFVFQSANLIPQMDLLDNVILPLTYRKMSEKEMREKGMALLERFGLADWRRHYPNELSGGQKQRVAIARAIITEPEIILADEPTGQLDSVSTAAVMDILCGINRELGATLVVVTHEKSVAEVAGRIISIKDGEIWSDESTKLYPYGYPFCFASERVFNTAKRSAAEASHAERGPAQLPKACANPGANMFPNAAKTGLNTSSQR